MIGWASVLFFGLGAIVGAIHLVPGMSYLRLTPDGFIIKSMYRISRPVRWDSVSEFRVAKMEFLIKMVVFDALARPDAGLSAINRQLVGAQAGLPDTYGRSAEDLAALLNQWRDRALDRDATSPP